MLDFERLLSQLDAPVWVYDFPRQRILWANPAGLALWDAPSLAVLQARDLADDMSASVAVRLAQYREDFAGRGETFHETWTLYPNGRPRRIRVKCSGLALPGGELAMLCEAKDVESVAPDAVRSVEALLHTSVMISLFERDGRQLYANPAARTAYGAERAGLYERFADPAAAAAFRAGLESDRTAATVAQVRRCDGAFWHHVVGVACHDAVTGAHAVLLSESDVTGAQEARFALEAARNDAVRTNHLKSGFLARMSHEIRTPINGVIGLAQVLDAKLSNAEHKALLAMILESGESLLSIVNDVLDLSKIESGKLELERIEFFPRDLVAQAETLHRPFAVKRRIALSVGLGQGQQVPRLGDPYRILQIVNNLVSNSIKFTQTGGVTATIDSPPGKPLTIRVSDTGIGMTEEQAVRIFDDFVQADTSMTRKFGGTGLGMSIVRSLVEAMNGDIEVRTRPGEGTQIAVRLPLEQSRPALVAAKPDLLPQRRPGHGLRVLAADDDLTNRMVLEGLLLCHDIEAEVVASGEDAVERIRDERFDILLLDISMPKMDGIQTLQTIRSIETRLGMTPTPAIAVTANAFKHQITAYLKAGFQDHVAKPIRSELLIGCMRKVLADAGTAGRILPAAGEPKAGNAPR